MTDDHGVGLNELSGALETCFAVVVSSLGGHPAAPGPKIEQPRVPGGPSAFAAREPGPWAPPRVPASRSREVAGLLGGACCRWSRYLLRPAKQDGRHAFHWAFSC